MSRNFARGLGVHVGECTQFRRFDLVRGIMTTVPRNRGEVIAVVPLGTAMINGVYGASGSMEVANWVRRLTAAPVSLTAQSHCEGSYAEVSLTKIEAAFAIAVAASKSPAAVKKAHVDCTPFERYLRNLPDEVREYGDVMSFDNKADMNSVFAAHFCMEQLSCNLADFVGGDDVVDQWFDEAIAASVYLARSRVLWLRTDEPCSLPLPVIAPVIDGLNHSSTDNNVEALVHLRDRCIVLSATHYIPPNSELLLRYLPPQTTRGLSPESDWAVRYGFSM